MKPSQDGCKLNFLQTKILFSSRDAALLGAQVPVLYSEAGGDSSFKSTADLSSSFFFFLPHFSAAFKFSTEEQEGQQKI